MSQAFAFVWPSDYNFAYYIKYAAAYVHSKASSRKCDGNISVPNYYFNPIALTKTKIVYNFGLSECSKVQTSLVASALKYQSVVKSLIM